MSIHALMTVKNRKEFTLKCISSLVKQTYKDIKIVVVDDGSTDGSAEEITKQFQEVKILKGSGNLWFTGGMRMGIEYILKISKKGDFLCFLNNDTVLAPDLLENLLKVARNEENSCVGSIGKSLKTDSLMYVVHEQKRGITCPAIIEFKKNELLKSECLNTRGTLVPIEIFQKIGNLSKLFPHYGSDYDFFYRAQKAGYKLIVNPKAVVYSQDDDKGLSERIREKEKISLKEFYQLFFNRRSAFNLYSRTLLVLLYTPFPQKIYTISKILLNVPYVFFKKVIF